MIQIFLLLPLSVALLAKEQPKHKMALPDNLAAYWNMAQNPAVFPVHDQTGNGNNLTGYNSPLLVDGNIGKGIQFNGTNQFLSIASNSGFSHQGGEFTAFLWFMPLALAHQKVIATTTEWGVQMILSGGNYYVSVDIENETVTVTDVPLVVGEWYFIALGYRAIDITDRSYVWASVNLSDRVREYQSGLTPAPGPFSIAGTAASGWISGVFDDAALFRRSLTAQEIRSIYKKGKGLPFEDYGSVTPCREITCCD